MSRLIVAVIGLPKTVLVFVPTLIVWFTRNTSLRATPADPASLLFWLGLLAGLAAAALALWSMVMFFRFGEGTAAPWDPPKRLGVRGPYRHVRSPILSGVIGVLPAESMLFQSWPWGVWAFLFAVGNMIYFPLSEEPALRERFGDDDRLYAEQVGRWIPRLTP